MPIWPPAGKRAAETQELKPAPSKVVVSCYKLPTSACLAGWPCRPPVFCTNGLYQAHPYSISANAFRFTRLWNRAHEAIHTMSLHGLDMRLHTIRFLRVAFTRVGSKFLFIIFFFIEDSTLIRVAIGKKKFECWILCQTHSRPPRVSTLRQL